MKPDLDRFFRAYAELYNRALAGEDDYAAIAACFAPCFVGAGPAGVVCGENGAEFAAAMEKNYAFYRGIGAKRMIVRRCETTEIDATHFMAKVFYRAEYEKSGAPIEIDFDVTYLLETTGGEAKIFAFVTGDEMGAYKRAGLID